MEVRLKKWTRSVKCVFSLWGIDKVIFSVIINKTLPQKCHYYSLWWLGLYFVWIGWGTRPILSLNVSHNKFLNLRRKIPETKLLNSCGLLFILSRWQSLNRRRGEGGMEAELCFIETSKHFIKLCFSKLIFLNRISRC